MDNLDEKIIEELSQHNGFVKYSDLREKFRDPNFPGRLSFLITIEKAFVVGWDNEKSKYPEEARMISRVHGQCYKDKRRVVMGCIEKSPQDIEGIETNEPLLVYKPNLQKILRHRANRSI